MFDGMLCKLTHQKVITLKDVIDGLMLFVWLVVYPIFEVCYCIMGGSYSTCLTDASQFCAIIDLVWLFGLIAVPFSVAVWVVGIYEFTSHVKIAECPLNKD